MSDDSVTKIAAFHRELCALSATGLPLDLGMDPSLPALSARLEQIESALASRLRRGESAEKAIAEQPGLPAQYRAALSIWLRCDDPTVALDRVTSAAVARRQFGMSLGQSMVYPLIVLSLAYFAFIYICNATAPKIEAIYAQLAYQPSESLAFLTASRQLMPIWGPLLPLLLVVLLVWWRWSSKRAVWNWLPGSSRYLDAIQNANRAQQLARLTESGLSLDESLKLVRTGETNGSNSDTTGSLPALLQWAIKGDLGSEATPRVLQLIAQTYRSRARRQSAIWRIAAPSFCGVLLGGTFVLGYCLSLFLPMVQLLKDISLPTGV